MLQGGNEGKAGKETGVAEEAAQAGQTDKLPWLLPPHALDLLIRAGNFFFFFFFSFVNDISKTTFPIIKGSYI